MSARPSALAVTATHRDFFGSILQGLILLAEAYAPPPPAAPIYLVTVPPLDQTTSEK